MSTFSQRAAAGDALGALRSAVVNGALWAIALSWSNAIREATRALVPDEARDVVVAELAAATLTTVLGIAVALIAARQHWGCHKAPPPPPPAEAAAPRRHRAPQQTPRPRV